MPEHTIAENLTRLQNATTAIGNAITAKGGTVASGDGLEDFASDIASIPSGGGVEFSNSPANFKYSTNALNLNITIPNGCTTVGAAAFSSFADLRTVNMPNTINKIESNAFINCRNLESVILSPEITTIEANSFFNCSSLKNVEIFDKVREIGTSAFSGCTSMESIKFHGTTQLPSCQTNTFGSLPTTCIIYVPTGYVSQYASLTYLSTSTYTYVEY